MNSGFSAVAPHGAGSGGTVNSTRPPVRSASAGHTFGAVSTTNVDPAQPSSYAAARPGVASQSSSSPVQSTRESQETCIPPAVVTLGPSGSTATARSLIQVQPSGITEAAGRSSVSIVASPPPT